VPLSAELQARLREILARPTAPFAEGRVHAAIRAAVAASPRLRERFDAHGNHIVSYGRGRPRLLFACHTDHPALVSNGDGTATIRGGIKPGQLAGTRLRRLDAGGGLGGAPRRQGAQGRHHRA